MPALTSGRMSTLWNFFNGFDCLETVNDAFIFRLPAQTAKLRTSSNTCLYLRRLPWLSPECGVLPVPFDLLCFLPSALPCLILLFSVLFPGISVNGIGACVNLFQGFGCGCGQPSDGPC